MTEITGEPAYRQIASDLREKIAAGAYAVGDAVPPTKELMKVYGGSITVVRAAIRELQNEGILIGQPGKGVYVQREPTGSEISRDRDVPGRLAEVEVAVDELADHLNDTVDPDLKSLREQLGVLQGQIMDLYSKVGAPYPHQQSTTTPARKAGGKTARSA